MVKTAVLFMSCVLLSYTAAESAGEPEPVTSKITEVKLYQNQAQIIRKATVSLKKGQNTVILGDLPQILYDWSAKGSLPKKFKGKILSLEVTKKALVKKRQKKILEIEEKLQALRDRDQVYADELKTIASQEKFLDSILDFTNQTVSKELATRIPQVKVWESTLVYVNKKKNDLLTKKRTIERDRENLGKEIQKWEFELSQIAGYNYFRNYQSMNSEIMKNRSSLGVQQFANINEQYAQRRTLLTRPTEKVDIEKRLIVNVFASKDSETEITFSYIIPNTYWQMLYDIRASNEKKNINMVVYANIYQKTGEDWNDVDLFLSTGSPVNSISAPSIYPWYLDVYQPRKYDLEGAAGAVEYKKSAKMKSSSKEEMVREDEDIAPAPESTVKDKGPYLEIGIPLKQSIVSSSKYQKKFIKDFALIDPDKVKFYYELMPSQARTGYLKVSTTNTTALPWLSGESQIFLENEFMGKVTIPYTPLGKKEDFVLGLESRITSEKELVKKYEDTSGMFGGNRRISYQYRITVENQMKKPCEVMVLDTLPVSRNEKITVEVKNVSAPFFKDDEFEKSTDHARGTRKWKLELDANQKKEITYEVIVSFDKDITVRGLR